MMKQLENILTTTGSVDENPSSKPKPKFKSKKSNPSIGFLKDKENNRQIKNRVMDNLSKKKANIKPVPIKKKKKSGPHKSSFQQEEIVCHTARITESNDTH